MFPSSSRCYWYLSAEQSKRPFRRNPGLSQIEKSRPKAAASPWTRLQCSPKSNESFCSFVGHFLEDETQRVLIDFVSLPHPDTGSLLSEKLNGVLSYFEIQDTLISVTSDGA